MARVGDVGCDKGERGTMSSWISWAKPGNGTTNLSEFAQLGCPMLHDCSLSKQGAIICFALHVIRIALHVLKLYHHWRAKASVMWLQ